MEAGIYHSQVEARYSVSYECTGEQIVQFDLQEVCHRSYLRKNGHSSNCGVLRLPDLLVEVEKRVQSLKNDIRRLPINTPEDPLMTILKLTNAFKKDVELLVKGRPEAGKPGLVQTFRRSKEQFGKAIFRQAPEFKPYDRPLQSPLGIRTQISNWNDEMDEPGFSLSPTGTLTPPDVTDELFEAEEDLELSEEDPRTFVYLNEVLEVAK
jgi:hypothetical protein